MEDINEAIYDYIRQLIDLERLKFLVKWKILNLENEIIVKWHCIVGQENLDLKKSINEEMEKRSYKGINGVVNFVLSNDDLRLLWALKFNRNELDTLCRLSVFKIYYDKMIRDCDNMFVKAELNRNKIQWTVEYHTLICVLNEIRLKDQQEVIKIAELNLKYGQDNGNQSFITKFSEELEKAKDPKQYKTISQNIINGRKHWIEKFLLKKNIDAVIDFEFIH